MEHSLSMSEAWPNFRYQPLDRVLPSIRLLQVCSGTSPIRFLLGLTEVLDQAFTCLPTTSGDGQDVCEIYINEQRFLVKVDLYDFLRVTREHYSDLSLCIDAV